MAPGPAASPLTLVLATESAEQTRELGRRLGAALRPGETVLLHGDLGAGKTTVAQGIAAGLGVAEPVQSPTFTLVHEYDGRDAAGESIRLYHLDLYRLDEHDLDGIGVDDYLASSDGVCLVEWPERAGDRLPAGALLVRLEPRGQGERRIVLSQFGEDGGDPGRLDGLRRALLDGRPAATAAAAADRS